MNIFVRMCIQLWNVRAYMHGHNTRQAQQCGWGTPSTTSSKLRAYMLRARIKQHDRGVPSRDMQRHGLLPSTWDEDVAF
jgi:hypothetical protein